MASPIITLSSDDETSCYDDFSDSLSNDGSTMPTLAQDPSLTVLQSHKYPDLGALVTCIQEWARDNGFAFVKRRVSNYRVFDDKRLPTYFLIECDRGPSRPSESRGQRTTATQKIDCPFKIKASATVGANWRWSFKSRVIITIRRVLIPLSTLCIVDGPKASKNSRLSSMIGDHLLLVR